MKDKTSNDRDFNVSERTNEESTDFTCKDGFCFIPNLDKNKTITKENINIFDPL
tara:strand:+ start:222 stop:383 length:162 start_codon:yes stop_codon:yes gene_type:complete